MDRLMLMPIVALIACGSARAEPSSARQVELLHLLRQDCGSCHGMTMKGGLGPALTPATLAGKPNAALVETILDGRPGTPMPPWAFEVKPDEALWLIERLREGLRNGG